MRIELSAISKRFGKQRVLNKVDKVFESGSRSCITGANGAGKSTLLRIISGNLSPDQGQVQYLLNGKHVARSEVFSFLALAAPYLEMYPDLTVLESIALQASFKPIQPGMDAHKMLQAVNLAQAGGKYVKDLSSGMRQRLKLALALYADTPLLLLDEPTANLDDEGVSTYHQMMAQVAPARTVVVCSNDVQREAPFCNEHLALPQ